MKKVLIVDDISSWVEHHSRVINAMFDDAEITTANSANEGYNHLLANKPFDIILTDLQMENNYYPKYAGEWFVEQIKTFKSQSNAKVVIISATNDVRRIAERLGVECIPKSTALICISAYEEILKK